MDNNETPNRGSLWGWLIGAGILALVAIVAVALFQDTNNFLNTNNDTTQESRLNTIASNPESYYGQSVNVRGEIDNLLSSQAFLFDEEGSAVGDEILVLSRQPVEAQGGGTLEDTFISDGQDVRVNGTVQQLTIAEAEQELGIDLDPEIELEFETRPVIVADSIELLPEEQN